MKKVTILFFALVFAFCETYAQQREISLGTKIGHNVVFGKYSALSVAGSYTHNHWGVRGGGEYNNIGRIATELRPTYYRDCRIGRLSGELLLHYSTQSRVANYALGGGASLDTKNLWVTFGYYHRTIEMGGESLRESFNFYYEAGIRCLPTRERWELNVIFSNSRMFELERHYQPTYTIEGGWSPSERLGIDLSINYKPAGMFNMSSNYYQFYTKVGVCYRW